MEKEDVKTPEDNGKIEKGVEPPKDKAKPGPSPPPPPPKPLSSHPSRLPEAAVAEILETDIVVPPKEVGAASLVRMDDGGLQICSLQDLIRFARLLVEDEAAPKGMKVGAVALAVQAGYERGLGLSGGMNFGTVINGRFAWNGQGAYSLIQNSKVCKPGTLRFWTEGEGENRKGVAVAHRIFYKEADRREFTVKQAKQAHLWGKAGPWQQFPDRQLAWRALGFLARDVFPDVLGGFPLAEEAVDFEPFVEERPRITEKSALPPPAAGDPLLEALKVEPQKKAQEEAIDVEAKPPEDPEPPMSHEEADKELAKGDQQLEFP